VGQYPGFNLQARLTEMYRIAFLSFSALFATSSLSSPIYSSLRLHRLFVPRLPSSPSALTLFSEKLCLHGIESRRLPLLSPLLVLWYHTYLRETLSPPVSTHSLYPSRTVWLWGKSWFRKGTRLRGMNTAGRDVTRTRNVKRETMISANIVTVTLERQVKNHQPASFQPWFRWIGRQSRYCDLQRTCSSASTCSSVPR
jgi:hypothetical protein